MDSLPVQKQCSKCLEFKQLDQFYQHPKALYKRQSQCKSCRVLIQREYRELNPDINKKIDRKKYLRSKVQLKNERYLRNYGITLKDFNDLLEKQNNECLICQEKNKRFHLDHCHKTGKIRGILCAQCNTGIGLFKENVEYLTNAIRYITK